MFFSCFIPAVHWAVSHLAGRRYARPPSADTRLPGHECRGDVVRFCLHFARHPLHHRETGSLPCSRRLQTAREEHSLLLCSVSTARHFQGNTSDVKFSCEIGVASSYFCWISHIGVCSTGVRLSSGVFFLNVVYQRLAKTGWDL